MPLNNSALFSIEFLVFFRRNLVHTIASYLCYLPPIHFLMPPRDIGDHWCFTVGNADRLLFRKMNKKFFMWEY